MEREVIPKSGGSNREGFSEQCLGKWYNKMPIISHHQFLLVVNTQQIQAYGGRFIGPRPA